MTDGPPANESAERTGATTRALAGLMALSVAAIFAHHAAQPQAFPGDLGVVTFLLSAGYSLAIALACARPWNRTSLRQFWRDHLAVTYPLFVLLVVAFAFGATTLSHSFARYIGQAFASLTFTVNLFASAHVNMGSFLHLWPFAMEEQWFLAMAVAALYLSRRPVATGALVNALLAIAALSSLDEIVTHSVFRPDAQLAPLALATAMALSRSSDLQGWRAFQPSARVGALAGVGIVAVLAWGTVANDFASSLRVPAVTWLGLILLAHLTNPAASGPVVDLLGSRLLTTMGSFAVVFYLCHYPLLHLIGSHPNRWLGITFALLASAAAAIIGQLGLNYALASFARRKTAVAAT